MSSRACRLMETRPQKKVSSACSYCKLRKRKCSATLPCDNCIANHKKCVLGQVVDGRRKASIKRARQDSAFYKQALHSLLGLSGRDYDHTLRNLIDENASLDDIAEHLCTSSTRSSPHTENPIEHKEVDQSVEPSPEHLLQTHNGQATGSRDLLPLPKHADAFGNLPSSAAVAAAGYNVHFQNNQVSNFRPPLFMVQPLNYPADQLSMTTLLVCFRDWCRHALSSGIPEEMVLGAGPVNLEVALRGHRLDSARTPSTWISEVQQQFESFDVYVRLITIHLVSRYLRWVISPTAENYASMPECMRPTLSQTLIPHHAAIDICSLPALRDILIQRDHPSKGNDDREDIVVFQLAGVRTNWTGDWNSAVIFDPKLGYHTLSQQFTETASKVEEWIAGRAVLSKFPGLAGKMRFAEEQSISVDGRQIHEMATSPRSGRPCSTS